jgi:hypothetical protein
VEGQSFIASVLERDDSTTATLVATIVFLPQLFIALTGGLLAITLARLVGVRHRQQPAMPLTKPSSTAVGNLEPTVQYCFRFAYTVRPLTNDRPCTACLSASDVKTNIQASQSRHVASGLTSPLFANWTTKALDLTRSGDILDKSVFAGRTLPATPAELQQCQAEQLIPLGSARWC